MGTCPKSSWSAVKAMLHSVDDQPDTDQVHAQYDKLLDAVAGKLPQVHTHLDGTRADLPANTCFPKEIRRRTDVVGVRPRPGRRDPPGRRRPGRSPAMRPITQA